MWIDSACSTGSVSAIAAVDHSESILVQIIIENHAEDKTNGSKSNFALPPIPDELAQFRPMKAGSSDSSFTLVGLEVPSSRYKRVLRQRGLEATGSPSLISTENPGEFALVFRNGVAVSLLISQDRRKLIIKDGTGVGTGEDGFEAPVRLRILGGRVYGLSPNGILTIRTLGAPGYEHIIDCAAMINPEEFSAPFVDFNVNHSRTQVVLADQENFFVVDVKFTENYPGGPVIRLASSVTDGLQGVENGSSDEEDNPSEGAQHEISELHRSRSGVVNCYRDDVWAKDLMRRPRAARNRRHRVRSGFSKSAGVEVFSPSYQVYPCRKILSKSYRSSNASLYDMHITSTTVAGIFRPVEQADGKGSSEKTRHGFVILYSIDEDAESRYHFKEPTLPIPPGSKDKAVLYLTSASVMTVLVAVDRKQLLDELIMFQNADLATSLCSLNGWEPTSLNTYSLEAGLKHRQLGLVSKVLGNLKGKQVETACHLLLKSVEESQELVEVATEIQTEAFANKLLKLAMSFLARVVHEHSSKKDNAADAHFIAVHDLAFHLAKLRNFVENSCLSRERSESRAPNLGDNFRQDHNVSKEKATLLFSSWDELNDSAVIKDALLNGNLPLAQSYLNSRHASNLGKSKISRPVAISFTDVKRIARMEIYNQLVLNNYDRAKIIISNLGETELSHFEEIFLFTISRHLRSTLLEQIGREKLAVRSEIDGALIFLAQIEKLYPLETLADISGAKFEASRNLWKSWLAGDNYPIRKLGETVNILPAKRLTEGSTELGDKPPSFRGEGNTVEFDGGSVFLENEDLHGIKAAKTNASKGSPERRTSSGIRREFYGRLGFDSSKGGEIEDIGITGYSQLNIFWVLQWSSVTRERILLDSDKHFSGVSRGSLLQYLISHFDTGEIVKLGAGVGYENDQAAKFLARFLFDDQASCCSKSLKDLIFDQMPQERIFSLAFLAADFGLDVYPFLFKLLSARGFLLQSPDVGFSESNRENLDRFHCYVLNYLTEREDYLVAFRYIKSHGICAPIGEAHECADTLLTHVFLLRSLVDKPELLADAVASATRLFIEAPASDDISEKHFHDKDEHLTHITNLLCGKVKDFDSNIISITKTPRVMSEFPTLEALANFLGSDGENSASSCISVFDLLAVSSPFELDRILSWKKGNVKDDGFRDLPRFSGEMSEKYSIEESIDFKYYLIQGRPQFAIERFLEQNGKTRNSHIFLPGDTKTVFELAIEHFWDNSVTTACVTFLSALDAAPQEIDYLRLVTNLANRVNSHGDDKSIPSSSRKAQEDLQPQSEDRINPASFEYAHGNKYQAVSEEFKACAASFLDSRLGEDKRNEFDVSIALNILRKIEVATQNLAVIEHALEPCCATVANLWASVQRFCVFHALPLSAEFLKVCAKNNDWVQLLCQTQLWSHSARQTLQIINSTMSQEPVKAHLKLVFSRECDAAMQEDRRPIQDSGNVTGNKVVTRSDVIKLVRQCEKSIDPVHAFLKMTSLHQQPLLSIFARCVAKDCLNDGADSEEDKSLKDKSNCLNCICTWLDVSLSLRIGLYDNWTLDDLKEILVRLCTQGKNMNFVAEALSIFDPGNPLLYIANFFSSFSRNEFSSCESQLSSFVQRLTQPQTFEPLEGGEDPEAISSKKEFAFLIGHSEWVQCTVDKMVNRLMDSMSCPEKQGNLLKILAGGGFSGDSERLYKIFNIVSKIGINMTMGLENPTLVVSELVKCSKFDDARSFAWLHKMSEHDITILQVENFISSLKKSGVWELPNSRVEGWTKCSNIFSQNLSPALMVAEFFTDKYEREKEIMVDVDPHPNQSKELLLILVLALKWFRNADKESGDCTDKIINTENLMWSTAVEMFSINHDVELPEEVAETMFGGDGNLSGWGTRDLHNVDSLQFYNLDWQAEASLISSIPSARRGALEAIIGRFLRYGDVIEAQQFCKRFNLKSADVNAVHAGFLLALELCTPRELPESLMSAFRVDQRQLFYHADAEESLMTLSNCCVSVGRETSERVETNYQVAKILNTRFRAIFKNNAIDVLRLCIQREVDHFRVASRFIKCNMLNPIRVTEELAGLFVKQLALTDESGELDNSFSGTPSSLNSNIARRMTMDESALHTQPSGKMASASSWTNEEFASYALLCGDPGEMGRAFVRIVRDNKEKSPDSLSERSAVCGSYDDYILVSLSINDMPSLSANCEVELLIRANFCFVLGSSIMGVGTMLQVARERIEDYSEKIKRLNHVDNAEEIACLYRLIVRLFVGLKKFHEMAYVFQILIEADQFELLLKKVPEVDKSEYQQAIIDLLRLYCPSDTDKYQMAALHFRMFREIAENRRDEAMGMIAKNPTEMKELMSITHLLSVAGEYFLKENYLIQARNTLTMARLVGLQMETKRPLLNLDREGLRLLLREHRDFTEAQIVVEVSVPALSSTVSKATKYCFYP